MSRMYSSRKSEVFHLSPLFFHPHHAWICVRRLYTPLKLTEPQRIGHTKMKFHLLTIDSQEFLLLVSGRDLRWWRQFSWTPGTMNYCPNGRRRSPSRRRGSRRSPTPRRLATEHGNCWKITDLVIGDTLPETNSSPLKMVVSNRNSTFQGVYFQVRTVSFREGTSTHSWLVF